MKRFEMSEAEAFAWTNLCFRQESMTATARRGNNPLSRLSFHECWETAAPSNFVGNKSNLPFLIASPSLLPSRIGQHFMLNSSIVAQILVLQLLPANQDSLPT